LRDRQALDTTHVDFQPFSDVADRVGASVRRVRESGLLPDSYELHAFVYDVSTGRLEPVEA
jgi:carbonic anhydrase